MFIYALSIILILTTFGCQNFRNSADAEIARSTRNVRPVSLGRPFTPRDRDLDGSPDARDCNPSDSTVYPGATEICDGIDNNCDGSVDENLPIYIYYADFDGDGYGDSFNLIDACGQPEGYVTNTDDCNDNDPMATPDDFDGDGWAGCPDGSRDYDCNDADTSVNPDAMDINDGIDNNCNGLVDSLSAEIVSCTDNGRQSTLVLSLTDTPSLYASSSIIFGTCVDDGQGLCDGGSATTAGGSMRANGIATVSSCPTEEDTIMVRFNASSNQCFIWGPQAAAFQAEFWYYNCQI